MTETTRHPVGLPGLMQEWPLTMNRIIEHANRWHRSREVVSCLSSGEVVRHSYGDIYVMAARLSHALLRFGIEHGQCVATMAMNGSRHLAAWYGIFGIGAVCHTLNPRLYIEQIVIYRPARTGPPPFGGRRFHWHRQRRARSMPNTGKGRVAVATRRGRSPRQPI